MRFKKGSIIEVWSKNELPSGSWRCAEVVCSDGHTYTVKYKLDTWVSDEAMERVSRNSIRPSPPSVELLESWAPGDVLEVFQIFSWKMATVCKVLGRNDFLIRLVGFSHEFKVCGSDLRVRQSWQDGKWFMIGKAEVGGFNTMLPDLLQFHLVQITGSILIGYISETLMLIFGVLNILMLQFKADSEP